MSRDKRIMDKALKLAHTSPHNRFKMCAILAKGNKILSIGFNSHRTHPLQVAKNKNSLNKDKITHAELDALIGIKPGLAKGSTMYVARIRRLDGQQGSSRPCPDCMSILKRHKIRKIVYIENTENREMGMEKL